MEFARRRVLALQLRTCRDQALALFVVGETLEVLDEALGQILCLGVPLGLVGISVTRVEDRRVHVVQCGRHFQIEDRQYLGLGFLDGTVQDGVNDGAGILDGDALAGAIPAGVDQIGFRAGRFHPLHQLLTVLGRSRHL